MTVTRFGCPTAVRGAISDSSPVAVPKDWPPEVIAGVASGALAVVVKKSVEKSSSGAYGANACQAATTAGASAHGHAI